MDAPRYHMKTWDEIDEAIAKLEFDPNLTLLVGQQVVVVFLGNPYLRGPGAFRVVINAAIYDTRSVRLFEFSAQFFKELLNVRNKYGLDKWAFEIQCVDKDTYTIQPKIQISAEEMVAFNGLKLYDLLELADEEIG